MLNFGYPPTSMSDISDDGLTASVNVKMPYRDRLLTLASFPSESFDLYGEGPHEFVCQVAEYVQPFKPVTLVEVTCYGGTSARD